MSNIITKIFQKFLGKLINKAITKSVPVEVSETTTLPEVDPITLPGDNSRKALWKFILQTLISILTAILTALGATSCVSSN